MRITSNDKKVQVIELYKQNLTIQNICKIVGVCPQNASDILKLAGFEILKGHKNNDVNDSYFENLTHNSAWILGFTMADGCVTSGNHAYNLEYGLSINDLNVLEFIQNEICPKKLITFYESGKKSFLPGSKTCRLRISSKKILQSLSSYDIVPRKTGLEKIPNKISQEYLPSFLRGFIDGDGCFGFYPHLKAPFKFAITCSSSEFMEQFSNLFPGLHLYKMKGVNCYCISTQRYKIISEIGSFIYSTPGFFLERKKIKYQSILKHHEKTH